MRRWCIAQIVVVVGVLLGGWVGSGAGWVPAALADDTTATLGFRGRAVGARRVGTGTHKGGILVQQTLDQCPANHVLQVGDIVVGYGDIPLRSTQLYRTYLRRTYRPGDTIEVHFVRDGAERSAEVVLAALAPSSRGRAALCSPPPGPAVEAVDRPVTERRRVEVGVTGVLGWSSVTRVPPGVAKEDFGRTVGRLHGTGRATAYVFRHRGTARHEARGRLRRRYFGVGLAFDRFGSRYRGARYHYVLSSAVGVPFTWRTDYRPITRATRWTLEWGLQPGYKLSQAWRAQTDDGVVDIDLLEENRVDRVAGLARMELGLLLETGVNIALPGRHDLRLTVRAHQRLNPDVHFNFFVHHQLGVGLGVFL